MFYVWYDTWEEAKAGTGAAGDRAGYPAYPRMKFPACESIWLNTLQSKLSAAFVRGHAARRLRLHRRYSVHIYGYCSQVAAIALPLLLRRFRWRKDHERIIWYCG